MIGHLLGSIAEIKSNMRKQKPNRNKGLCWPCLWNKTVYYIKQGLRKIKRNGQ